MQLSTNYGLKLPEGTDNVKRQDFIDNFSKIDSVMKEHDTHLSDMVYQTAGGSATAITLTIKGSLVNGFPITFIANANNSGAATTINGKKLYKPGTTTSPNLIAGKAYTVWYNSTSDCFFIKASAEGTALAKDVRKNTTFSNDNDTGITGGLDLSLLVPGNIRAGITIDGVTGKSSVVDTADATVVANHMLSGETAYKNGAKVTGTMVDRSGDTACVSSDVSGTTLRLKASEGYRDGVNDNVTITSADFLAANILSGKNIFGINGDATIESLGGKRFASGSATTNSSSQFTVTGLSFTPSLVIAVITTYNAVCLFAKASTGIRTTDYKITFSHSSGAIYVSENAGIISNGFVATFANYIGLAVNWIAFE
ncbi:hypothetical protein [Clostridium beijerinckii]|uniref:hypothetical protein n=1 Tax=Clostridium beijerinckii TaxID=1520 RepID=UPI0002F2AF58|nr:hypothetical protein [Clostridium beijerinckii]